MVNTDRKKVSLFCQIYLTDGRSYAILYLSNIFDRLESIMNERMRQARTEKGFSQTELAKRIGVSRQTINMIENGDYNPTIGLCRNICRVLGCTLNDLFWEEE